MDIILANPRGFCAGVNRAIKTLEAAIETFGTPLYVYHEIVHNTWVVEHFRSKNVTFVDDIDHVPHGARLLFSAHGVAPTVRRRAQEHDIVTIDATCPLVHSIHRHVLRFAAENYSIILIGHRGHDEVIGAASEAPEHVQVIEKETEIATLVVPDVDKVAYLTQTTFSQHETKGMVELLRKRFPKIVSPGPSSICYATQNRQDAVAALAHDRDVVLVIGSQTSSNSKRLAEQAELMGICSYQVDGPDDVRSGWFQGNEKILVTAGASAPEHLVQECVQVLSTRFQTTVEERVVHQEDVTFPLPKELLCPKSLIRVVP